MGPKRQSLHPAHPASWPIWLGLAVLVPLAQLPWRWLLAIGRGAGAVMWLIRGRRRHIAETNIRLCFPEHDAEQQQLLARASVLSAGMGMMELVGVYFRRRLPDDSRLEVGGQHHLERALQRGEGVLLLGMHFTTLEVAGALLAQLTPYGAVYRPNDHPLLDRIVRRGRGRHVRRYIDRQDLRGLVRSLQRGEVVWYAPDQDYGLKHSIFTPFFGVPAATITATARIARLSGAPVIPMACYRLPKGRYRLVFEPPLPGFPSGDDQADATVVNTAIESAVRRAPQQYLWIHRRFKHQPDGVNPYPKR